MLIEVFTDGRVMIDGEVLGPHARAESILKEFLLHPEKLTAQKRKAA